MTSTPSRGDPQRFPEPGRREPGPDPVSITGGTEPGGVPRSGIADRNTKPLKPTPADCGSTNRPAVLREVDGLRELVAGTPHQVACCAWACRRYRRGGVAGCPRLAHEYPELRAQVGTGWGSHLLARLENANWTRQWCCFRQQGVPRRLSAPRPRAHGTLRGGRPDVPSRRDACSIATTMLVLNPDGSASVPACNGPCRSGPGLQLNLETFGASCNGPGRRGSGSRPGAAPALRVAATASLQVLQLEDSSR